MSLQSPRSAKVRSAVSQQGLYHTIANCIATSLCESESLKAYEGLLTDVHPHKNQSIVHSRIRRLRVAYRLPGRRCNL